MPQVSNQASNPGTTATTTTRTTTTLFAGSNKSKTFPRAAAFVASVCQPLSSLCQASSPSSSFLLPLLSSCRPGLSLSSRGRVHPVNTATTVTTTVTIAAFRAPDDAGYRSGAGAGGCRGTHGAPSRAAAAVLRQQARQAPRKNTGTGGRQKGNKEGKKGRVCLFCVWCWSDQANGGRREVSHEWYGITQHDMRGRDTR